MDTRKINKLIRQLHQYDLACKETIQAIYSEVIEPTPEYIYSCRPHEPTELNPAYAPYYAVFRTILNGDAYHEYNKMVMKLQNIKLLRTGIELETRADTSSRFIIFRQHQFIHSISYRLLVKHHPSPKRFYLNLPFEISDADWHKLIYNDVFPPDFIIEKE